MTVMISPTQSILRGGRGKPMKGSPESTGSMTSSIVSASSSRWSRRGTSRERYSRTSRMEEPARDPLLSHGDSASTSIYDVGNVGSTSQDSDDPATNAVADARRQLGRMYMKRDSREDTEATGTVMGKTEMHGGFGSRQNVSPAEQSRHPFRPMSDAQNLSGSAAQSTGRANDLASPTLNSASFASRSGRSSPFAASGARATRRTSELKATEGKQPQRSPARRGVVSSKSDVGERAQVSSSLRDKAIKSLQIRKSASFGLDNDDENEGEPEAKANADFSVSSWDRLMNEVDQSSQSPFSESTKVSATESRTRHGRDAGGASSVVSSTSFSKATRKWKSSMSSRSYSKITVDDDGTPGIGEKDNHLNAKRSPTPESSLEKSIATMSADVESEEKLSANNTSTAFRRKRFPDVEAVSGDANAQPAGRGTSDTSAATPNSSNDHRSGRKAKSPGKVARLASFFSSRSTVKASSNTAGTSLSSASTGHDGNSTHSENRDHHSTKTTPVAHEKEYSAAADDDAPMSEVSKVSEHSQTYSTPRTMTPSSPSRMSNVSGTSSGYIGWPGTQDRTGGTVAIQPSYSGSDEGTFRGTPASEGSMSGLHDGSPTTAEVTKKTEREKVVVAEKEANGLQGDATVASRSGRAAGGGSIRGIAAPSNPRYVNGESAYSRDRNRRGIRTATDDSSDSEEDENMNPADFHLAAVVADVAAAASPAAASLAASPHTRASAESKEGYVTLRHLTKKDGISPSSPSTTGSSDSKSAKNSSVQSTQSKDGSRRTGAGVAVRRGALLTAQIHGSTTTGGIQNTLLSPAANEKTERSSSGRRTRFDLGDGENKSARTRFDLGDQAKSPAESIVDSEGGISIRNLFPAGGKGASAGASTARGDGRTPQSIRTSASSGFSDPWDIDNNSAVPSSAGDSDPFIDHGVEVDDLPFRERPRTLVNMGKKTAPVIDTSGSEMRMRSSGKKITQRHSPSADSVSPLSTGSSIYFGHRKRPSPVGTSSEHGPPTEEALSIKNRQTPSPQPGNAANMRGYRGFIDKTKDVPNLMDAVDSESQSTASTQTNSVPAKEQPAPPPPSEAQGVSRKVTSLSSPRETEVVGDTDSDVFSGISSVAPTSPRLQPNFILNGKNRVALPSASSQGLKGMGATHGETQKGLRVGKIGTVQTKADAFARRSTSKEFDNNFSEPEADQHEHEKTPQPSSTGDKRKGAATNFPRRLDAKDAEIRATRSCDATGKPRQGLNSQPPQAAMDENSAFSDDMTESGDEGPDLSHFAVEPEQVRELVKTFRRVCKYCEENGIDKTASDSKKAFALFEMRSRIMETDIERGLERMGGTVTVDDLVTTAYYRCAQRVRDAVIVSKAWRDGASPKDVVTASLLTRRAFATYSIRRAERRRRGRARVIYRREEVKWIDDTDFSLFRCASLGPRSMRGSEMFTIGDCQSILLKLTNERCMQLRNELDEATARQLQAEDFMREEAESGNDVSCTSDGDMTHAEMTYLSSMEDVKTIAKKLVVAERSFNLVRERIEKLVTKYETLLVKMEDGSASSIGTGSEESESDSDCDSDEDDNEKEILARRAQRAELRAEVAAREAKLAKDEARKIQASKQKELDELQRRLAELETKSSNPASDVDSRSRGDFDSQRSGTSKAQKSRADTRTILEGARSLVQEDTSQNVAKERIKAKFRSRRAEKTQRGVPTSRSGSESGSSIFTGVTTSSSLLEATKLKTIMNRTGGLEDGGNNRNRTAGEEMYQHLDFYARSLKAVNKKKTGQ